MKTKLARRLRYCLLCTRRVNSRISKNKICKIYTCRKCNFDIVRFIPSDGKYRPFALNLNFLVNSLTVCMLYRWDHIEDYTIAYDDKSIHSGSIDDSFRFIKGYIKNKDLL